jgi:hypothetical protein
MAGLDWARTNLDMGWTLHGQGWAGHGLAWALAGLVMNCPGHVLDWTGADLAMGQRVICWAGYSFRMVYAWFGRGKGSTGHGLGMRICCAGPVKG